MRESWASWTCPARYAPAAGVLQWRGTGRRIGKLTAPPCGGACRSCLSAAILSHFVSPIFLLLLNLQSVGSGCLFQPQHRVIWVQASRGLTIAGLSERLSERGFFFNIDVHKHGYGDRCCLDNLLTVKYNSEAGRQENTFLRLLSYPETHDEQNLPLERVHK